MPKHGKKSKRTRHGARKWILQALESVKGDVALRTSELHERASRLSGGELPGYSVYQALRTLVRKKVVTARREGRELTFRLTRQRAAPAPAAPQPTIAPPSPATASAVAPTAVSAAAPIHTIAPGEVAILHVTDTHVEAATNVHGQLVLARHKRPK